MIAKEDDAGDDADSLSPESEPTSKATISSTACQIIALPPSLDTVGTAFKPINSTILSITALEESPEANGITSLDNAVVCRGQEELTAEEALSILAKDDVAENTDELKVDKHTKKQKEYICGFCSEYGFYKRLSRPSDLKRHLESTHHTNNLWVCPKENCRRVFQWLGAFKEHARYYHKARVRIYDAEVITLCPQTVFACGFAGCSQVYEAVSEFEASPARDKYIAHVVTHLQSSLEKPRAWTFTVRMRNLLSQSALSNIWPPPSLSYEQNLQLKWDARSGSVLQKLLETRHLGSPSSLIRNAIALGSVSCREVQLARGNAVLPILGQCQAEVLQIDMPAVQATPSPAEPADDTAGSAMAKCSESLVTPNHSDALEAYRPEHSNQDAMQEILDCLHDQPVEQQYLSEDFTDSMEWLENNDSEEGNDIL
ncbi:hypothetical protein TGAMA5MH_08766 [Trichoderma gamsii]|uniref:C2H2-type domain-containing protein n=1 Tax=Trichoderma gamsii TaxID=398673 RepID=A0A2K0T1E2_9HYPO|nr:hypothetical protein TGAMA5MH_08766 [Trichoderma gamsii]